MHWYLANVAVLCHGKRTNLYLLAHALSNGYAKIALSPCEMKMNEDGGRSSGGDTRRREAVSARRTIGRWWGMAAEQ